MKGKVFNVKLDGANISINVSQQDGGFAINSKVVSTTSKSAEEATSTTNASRCTICGKYDFTEKCETDYICESCFERLKNKFIGKVEIKSEPVIEQKVVEEKPKTQKSANLIVSIINDFVVKNPPEIKIVNFKKYKVERLKELAITKLFELVLQGYNTKELLVSKTGLKETSISKYLSMMCVANLLWHRKGEPTWEVNPAVVYVKVDASKSDISKVKKTNKTKDMSLYYYIKKNPANIKICDYEKYKSDHFCEAFGTKIFELVKSGYNTPELISALSGVNVSAAERTLYFAEDAGLITHEKGTRVWEINSEINYINIE